MQDRLELCLTTGYHDDEAGIAHCLTTTTTIVAAVNASLAAAIVLLTGSLVGARPRA